MGEIDPDIEALLSQPVADDVREFVSQHIQRYLDEERDALRQGSPAEKAEAVARARERLRTRLKSLVAWARGSGRMD